MQNDAVKKIVAGILEIPAENITPDTELAWLADIAREVSFETEKEIILNEGATYADLLAQL